ncbi:hypothetical protein ACOSQ3_024435 [Xanthoceras sorbifolium]
MASKYLADLCYSLSLGDKDKPVPTGSGSLANMRFGYAEFWVQLHNVPLLCLTKDIGYFLGSQIGQVVEVDSTPSGDCLGKYLRMHVRIDIRKPLKRFLPVDILGDNMKTIMPLKKSRSDGVGSDTPSPPSTESHNKGGTKVGMGSKSAGPIVLSASPVALEEGLELEGGWVSFPSLRTDDINGYLIGAKGVVASKQIPSNAEYGTIRKGWKRRARTGMVIMDELQDLVQLGKREGLIDCGVGTCV